MEFQVVAPLKGIKMLRTLFCFISLGTLVLSGCATITNDTAHVPEIKRIQAPQYPQWQEPVKAEGSLWSDSDGINLFPDRRARKVGDTVVVRIVEDPEASLEANTSTKRSSSLDASKLKLFGFMKALAESNSRLAQNPGTDDLALASLGLKFDGEGTSDRKGHVKAYISAMVVQVLPNGNLYINGKREIKVNNEIQYITLSGVIRPDDVSPTNEISSAFVADARISYAGIGVVSDKQRPGWLGKAVDYVWPF